MLHRHKALLTQYSPEKKVFFLDKIQKTTEINYP